MGSSSSKNLANATSEVANSISNSTNVSNQQISSNLQNVTFFGCDVKAEYININLFTQAFFQNKQIINAKSSSALANSVQQQALQSAISKVGSMGVGFASAVNNTNMFCSINNDVINQISQSSKQLNSNIQSFRCEDSSFVVAKGLQIGFSNNADLRNKQILKSDFVTDINNEISQTIKQKASATVEGLFGFLIGLALVIAALGYGIAKPLSSGSFKIITAAIVVIVLILLGVFAYLGNWPPFFAKPIKCAVYSNLGKPDCECINQSMLNFPVKNSPLKYIYGITSNDKSINGINQVSLFSLTIRTFSVADKEPNNAGFTIKTKQLIDEGLTQLNNDLKLFQIYYKSIPNFNINPALKTIIEQFINDTNDPKSDSFKQISLLNDPNKDTGVFVRIPCQ